MLAARASRCAGDQGKYWEMHDSLFSNQSDLSEPHISELATSLGLDGPRFTACVQSGKFSSDIGASTSQAAELGIRGTPSFLAQPCLVENRGLSTGKTKMRERADRKVQHDAAVINDPLELRGGFFALARKEVGLSAKVNGITSFPAEMARIGLARRVLPSLGALLPSGRSSRSVQWLPVSLTANTPGGRLANVVWNP
jgi:hypothetical protein